jgi:hypothetical protein
VCSMAVQGRQEWPRRQRAEVTIPALLSVCQSALFVPVTPPREQQEAARLPLANPSDPCPWLDPSGAGRLQSP